MEIKFASGESGFYEGFALIQIARMAAECDPSDSNEIQLLDVLAAAGEAQCARLEFAQLRELAQMRTRTDTEGGWWRALFGPSRREILLSEQRIAALDRATRAEGSSFEALAETARVARERDDLKARIVELEAKLAELAKRAHE